MDKTDLLDPLRLDRDLRRPAGTRSGICTIVDLDSLEVDVDVNEAYIGRVAAGMPAEIVLDAYPDLRIAAHVVAIVPTADRGKATVRGRIGFELKDPRIIPDRAPACRFAIEPHALKALRPQWAADNIPHRYPDRVERPCAGAVQQHPTVFSYATSSTQDVIT